jgi:hypothetical protein
VPTISFSHLTSLASSRGSKAPLSAPNRGGVFTPFVEVAFGTTLSESALRRNFRFARYSGAISKVSERRHLRFADLSAAHTPRGKAWWFLLLTSPVGSNSYLNLHPANLPAGSGRLPARLGLPSPVNGKMAPGFGERWGPLTSQELKLVNYFFLSMTALAGFSLAWTGIIATRRRSAS